MCWRGELTLYARLPLGTSSLQDDVGGGCPGVNLGRTPWGSVFVRTDARSFDSVADSLREAATALRMTNFREG
jgi:hypothetical protein